MKTYRYRASAPSRLAAVLLSVLMALGAAVVMPVQAAHAAETEITEGHVTWGIKESWRNYIGVDGVELSGGVTALDTGEYSWPIESGTFDDDANTLILKLAGQAHFTSYCYSDGSCQLDSLFKDLAIEISPERQVILGTYSGIPRENPGGEREEYPGVVLADIDISTAEFSSENGETVWTSARTYAGEHEFLYTKGTPYDPVSISYSGPGGVPETGDAFDAEKAPLLTPSGTWIGDNAAENNRKVYASEQSDVIHVVEKLNFGTENAQYAIRALDLDTMSVQAETTVDLGNKNWFATAYDPATESLYLADGSTGDQDVATIHRVVFGGSDSYTREQVGEVPFPTVSTSNTVTSMEWDEKTDSLVVLATLPPVDRVGQGMLSILSEGDSGFSIAQHRLEAPVDGLGGEVSTPPGSTSFGSTATGANSAPQERLASLRDGSYLIAPSSTYRLEDDSRTWALPALRVTLEAGTPRVSLVEGAVPPRYSDRTVYTYTRVTVASDGSALLYGSGWSSTYQYVDVVDGDAQPVSDHLLVPDESGLNLGAAADRDHDVDYVFNTNTVQLSAFVGQQYAKSFRFSNLVRGGTSSYPLAVARDGSVILVVSDPDTGNLGLQRFALSGITPSVTEQPVSQTVDLGSNDTSQVSFTARQEGGTGEVGQQWQVKAPGSSSFEDIEGETGETLAIDAGRSGNGAVYRAVFSNEAGRVASEEATLTVHYTPLPSTHPQSVDLVEGTDAVFTTTFEGNPAPEVSWQRYDRGYWIDISSDDNFTVNSGEGLSSLTVKSTNTDQSGTRFRARATNDSGTGWSREATLTVRPAVEIPPEGLDIEGVVFEWGLNEEVQIKPPFGSANYLSAGTSDGDEASYSSEEGNVEVRHLGDGEFSVPTWSTRAAHVNAEGVEQIIRLKGGTARIEADGSATVSWEGSFSVNFYDGLVPFTITDPALSVSPTGTGTLTGDLSGYGSDMANPEVKEPIDPVSDATIATFSGVRVDPEGAVTVEPDYAGVEIELPDDVTPQNRETSGWGAWPQAFVDFHVATGLSSYWYSSGSSFDSHKAPSSFLVDFAANEGGEPGEEPTEEPTTEPTSEPTEEPTTEPTSEPTGQPTTEPTSEPTTAPTGEPTPEPTTEPTEEPTSEPTEQPTTEPTSEPTTEPTEEPTEPGGPQEPGTPDESDLTDANRGGVSVPDEAEEASTITVTVDESLVGTEVDPVLFSDPFSFDRVTVGADGTFEVTLPEGFIGAHRFAVYTAGGSGSDGVIGWDEITITAIEPVVVDTPGEDGVDQPGGGTGDGGAGADGSSGGDADGRPGWLPRTGAEFASVTGIGALLLVAGGIALAMARRRRSATAGAHAEGSGPGGEGFGSEAGPGREE